MPDSKAKKRAREEVERLEGVLRRRKGKVADAEHALAEAKGRLKRA